MWTCRLFHVMIAVISLMATGGCGCTNTGGSGRTNYDENSGNTLRIGIQPTRGALPLWVAKEEGYFAEMGINVELVTFQSGIEKDAAFQAGTIDGMFSDLVASMLLKQQGVPLRIITLICGGRIGEGRVAIVVSPRSSASNLQDLRGKELAVSPNNIIEFATDEILKEEGVLPQEVCKVSIPKINVRLSMLLENKFTAATLPEPQATLAQLGGGRIIADDHRNGYLYLVLSMQEKISKPKRSAVVRLLEALNRAIEDINEAPWRYRKLLISVAKISMDHEDIVRVARYSSWRVPSEEHVARVASWLKDKELMTQNLSYESLVDASFVQGRRQDSRVPLWLFSF